MGDPLYPLRWGPKVGPGGWSEICFRFGFYKEPNGNRFLTIPRLIRNQLKTEARVVREWSEPSMVTLAVILKCLFSYENLHTRVVRDVVRLFKSQGILKM